MEKRKKTQSPSDFQRPLNTPRTQHHKWKIVKLWSQISQEWKILTYKYSKTVIWVLLDIKLWRYTDSKPFASNPKKLTLHEIKHGWQPANINFMHQLTTVRAMQNFYEYICIYLSSKWQYNTILTILHLKLSKGCLQITRQSEMLSQIIWQQNNSSNNLIITQENNTYLTNDKCTPLLVPLK